jgi:single-stranded DNA-specific DHH superfamily exonuclease
VLGIVAARVAEQTGKPALLISFNGDVGRGSGRCTTGLHLRNALSACSEHLVAHGGHAAAAGLELRRADFEPFRARFLVPVPTARRRARATSGEVKTSRTRLHARFRRRRFRRAQ